METRLNIMIDEAFEVATTHDLSNANEQIKDVFKLQLKRIAMAAIDEIRNEISNNLQDKAHNLLK